MYGALEVFSKSSLGAYLSAHHRPGVVGREKRNFPDETKVVERGVVGWWLVYGGFLKWWVSPTTRVFLLKMTFLRSFLGTIFGNIRIYYRNGELMIR